LGKAIRYYRELIVPGIGGVRFVRQLSWSCAGIELSKQLDGERLSVHIANAIEALAFKLMWFADIEGVTGVRAFEKYENAMSYDELSNPKYYVQVTRRQATVRALLGMGLATGGMRMNTMSLTQAGRDLAHSFLYRSGGGRNRQIGNALINWIKNPHKSYERIPPEPMGAYTATTEEKSIVRACLCSSEGDGNDGKGMNRRVRLIEVLNKIQNSDMPDLDIIKSNLRKTPFGSSQAEEIETAVAFDDLIGSARNVIQLCASYMENADQKPAAILSDKLGENLDLVKTNAKRYLDNIEQSNKDHRDAIEFAEKIVGLNDADLLVGIVLRDGKILSYSAGKIYKGPLFKRHIDLEKEMTQASLEENEDEGVEEISTINKISQLHKLWKDCNHAQKQ
jgi:hypothetical protein